MLSSVEIKFGRTPGDMQKLRIVYEIGMFLEKAFGRSAYLHEGYGIYIDGYRLNDFSDPGLYGSSYISSFVRLDIMDFLFFILDRLKARGKEIQV